MSTSTDRGLPFWIAVWFGCGLVPKAPGTAGTFGALPLYFAVMPFGPAGVLAAFAVLLPIGVWASGHVARTTAEKDPQIVVVDEVLGVLLALAAAPATPLGIAAAVVAFRVCDHLKPWPARGMEALPGGWGVVMDDVLAGVWAAGLVLLMRIPGWLS